MKRIQFSLSERSLHLVGIYASRKDNWEKLIPYYLRHKLEELGDISNAEGFFISSRPIYVLVVFSEAADFHSTLSHETGHIARHIVWDIGDKITKGADEGHAMLETFIFETFKSELKKKYGMRESIEFKPNARQKKREIK